jgi:hypothetical protein
MKKSFITFNTQLVQLKEAKSDISESEREDEASHFHMDAALQFTQVDKEFKPIITNLFKQADSTINLDLREVILLDRIIKQKRSKNVNQISDSALRNFQTTVEN